MFIKKSYIYGLLLLVLFGLSVSPALAQQNEFSLLVSKTLGYASGGDIRGTFTLSVLGGNIQSVQFKIDGNVISTVTSGPFSVTFQTTAFSDGSHTISATVKTIDGRTVEIAPRTYQFVTSSGETSGMLRILLPLLGVVFGVLLLGVAAQVLLFRKKFASMPPGTQRSYGLRGGTVCPRCHRPYSIHIWALNMGFTSHLDRCDFCGKWAVVRRKPLEELRAAEQAELASFDSNPPVAAKTEEEKLREMLDKSKYSD